MDSRFRGNDKQGIFMRKNILINAGLTESQAEIYEFLLENNDFKASDIAKTIKRPRGVVYKGLDELIGLGLAEKVITGKITRFKAEHPARLEAIFAKKEKEVINDKKALENLIPELSSSFNLLHNKPGVRFYEGKKGFSEVLDHVAGQFTADTEIVSFVKIIPPSGDKEMANSINYFIRKRIEMNVKTRVIAIDTEEGEKLKAGDRDSLRETRLVKLVNMPLDFPGGEIFIYQDEICSVMMENNSYFAFTLQSQSIAQLLRAFFESEWALLPRNDSNSLRDAGDDSSFSKMA
jgi:sugar-specific transcriptional regulator TrmB